MRGRVQNIVYSLFFSFRKCIVLLLVLLCSSIYAQNIPESVSQELLNNIEKAKEHEERLDYNQAAYFYNKTANTYWAHNDIDRAIEFFLKALEMSDRLGNKNANYVLSTNLGLLFNQKGDRVMALEHFANATETARVLSRNRDVASSLINQANVSYETEELSDALDFLNAANSIAQELNDARLLRNVYSVYTKIYDKTGNREESSRYFDLFAAITRRIQQEEIRQREEEAEQIVTQATSRVREVEAEKQATQEVLNVRDLELFQKQKVLEEAEKESRERLMQIDLLNKERELQNAIIAHQNHMRNVYVGVIILIFIFSSFIFYSYYEKRKANILLRQKNDEIIRQNVEIQAQTEKLKELNQLKDKLFSIISHDLRSPLGSLVTLLNLTQQGYFTKEGFDEVIQELSKNVGYTSELLENLLNWAQSQLQGLKVQPQFFRLHSITSSRIELYAEQAKNKGVEVVNSTNETLEVYADSAMIELVLRNLLANAIKYCSKGDRITISSSVSQNEVAVKIADTGLGISPDNVAKLFGKEIFTTNGTSNEKGTGLGLILCRDFVALNGGKIWVKSKEGVGSEFHFTIPRVPVEKTDAKYPNNKLVYSS